jgi:hypothetical protein
MRTQLPLALVVLLTPLAAQAGAADVVACLKLDGAARYACYDRTVPALAADLESEKKSGLDLFGLFGGKATATKDFGNAPEKINAEVPAVSQMKDALLGVNYGDTGPIFTFANGQVWRAQEGRRVFLKEDGSDFGTVKKSLVGYVLTVNDGTGGWSVKRVK